MEDRNRGDLPGTSPRPADLSTSPSADPALAVRQKTQQRRAGFSWLSKIPFFPQHSPATSAAGHFAQNGPTEHIGPGIGPHFVPKASPLEPPAPRAVRAPAPGPREASRSSSRLAQRTPGEHPRARRAPSNPSSPASPSTLPGPRAPGPRAPRTLASPSVPQLEPSSPANPWRAPSSPSSPASPWPSSVPQLELSATVESEARATVQIEVT